MNNQDTYIEKLKNITTMVSFCPHCLTYGTPFGLRDTICGNCGKDGLRQYVGLNETIKLFTTHHSTIIEDLRKGIEGERRDITPIQYSDVEPKLDYEIQYHEQTLRIGFNQGLDFALSLLPSKQEEK